MSERLKIAFVQDALPFLGGAERVLQAALELFPGAPICTLVYNRRALAHSLIARHPVQTSFIDRLPLANHFYRNYLPLFPLAIEAFDLRHYDLILSFSYAVAHGVITHPGQLHLGYTFTPLRQAWQHHHEFLADSRWGNGVISWTAKVILHYMRLWDRLASERVDRFIAVSNWIAGCIWRAYRQPAEVIYPPVEVDRFHAGHPKGDYYVCLSRLTARKRVSLVVETFNRLGLPLLVIGDGPQARRLNKIAHPNVKLMGWLPDEEVAEILSGAKGLVHAAEEDFGIALVEAQAAGCPVIAFGGGGALETVIPGETGILFPKRSVDCLIEAVLEMERRVSTFAAERLKQNASRFRKERFQKELVDLIRHQTGVQLLLPNRISWPMISK
jgi:glycosyltransferase involved in cell wall biosynthesis